MDVGRRMRPDRLKDALLQENGYLVLRFLVQEVGAKLDEVLDTILRAITHLSRDVAWPHPNAS